MEPEKRFFLINLQINKLERKSDNFTLKYMDLLEHFLPSSFFC